MVCVLCRHEHILIQLYRYNLNSMLEKPEHISETYLSMLLAQFESDGYSVFVVVGTDESSDGANLPLSEADRIAIEQPTAPPKGITSRGYVLGGAERRESDADLKNAIAMSLGSDVGGTNEEFATEEEMDINAAILMSLNATEPKETDSERMRRIRLERFGGK